MNFLFVHKCVLASLMAASVMRVHAQTERIEPISFGDMNHWIVREVKESFIIGGQTKYLYEIAKGDSIFNNTPYSNTKSPWATSSVMAKVKGVVKSSITVFPEKRETGYAARLETCIEHCKVLGLIDIKVLASGTIFLGRMIEPITSTDNPQSKLITGVSFSKHPKTLIFDYKANVGGNSIKSTGFSKQKKLSIKDMAEVHLLLQHRWEDEQGNVYAKRVGTAWKYFEKSVKTWQNNYRMPIHYGDITSQAFYKPYMKLVDGDDAFYTKNSKGKIVPIHEVGWADPNEKVTHLILQFSSSNGGAYIGSPSNCLWVDNVKLAY